jgi:hypothetical protein
MTVTMSHTHRLRHVIKQLVGYIPDEVRNSERFANWLAMVVTRTCRISLGMAISAYDH